MHTQTLWQSVVGYFRIFRRTQFLLHFPNFCTNGLGNRLLKRLIRLLDSSNLSCLYISQMLIFWRAGQRCSKHANAAVLSFACWVVQVRQQGCSAELLVTPPPFLSLCSVSVFSLPSAFSSLYLIFFQCLHHSDLSASRCMYAPHPLLMLPLLRIQVDAPQQSRRTSGGRRGPAH